MPGSVRPQTVARTLDDVMRLAGQRYGGPRGFSTDEFCDTAQQVAATELKRWFIHVTETTEELDYGEALAWFGLRFKPSAPGDIPPKPWLGFTVKTESHRLMVSEVPCGTPAYEAGITPGDEILAIGNYRIHPDQWSATLEAHRAHEVVSLLVSRRGRLVNIPVCLEEEPVRRWVVERDPDATDLQRQRLTAWLGSSG
jgi:predicted metalloprotease with PDZ domain